jgi:hypothetical protein
MKQLIEVLVMQPEILATSVLGGVALTAVKIYAHKSEEAAIATRQAEDFVDVMHLVSGKKGARAAGLVGTVEAPTGTMWQEHAAVLCADLPEGYNAYLQNTALDMGFERTIAKYVTS